MNRVSPRAAIAPDMPVATRASTARMVDSSRPAEGKVARSGDTRPGKERAGASTKRAVRVRAARSRKVLIRCPEIQ